MAEHSSDLGKTYWHANPENYTLGEDRTPADNVHHQGAALTGHDTRQASGYGNNTTITGYFETKYKVAKDDLFDLLPLVETARNGSFPMRFCHIVPDQRYFPKLNKKQTDRMVKFSSLKPPERLATIRDCVRQLNWANDPWLNHFGMYVSKDPTVTQAVLLKAPWVVFGGFRVSRQNNGRNIMDPDAYEDMNEHGKKSFNIHEPKPIGPNPRQPTFPVGDCPRRAIRPPQLKLAHWAFFVLNNSENARDQYQNRQELSRKCGEYIQRVKLTYNLMTRKHASYGDANREHEIPDPCHIDYDLRPENMEQTIHNVVCQRLAENKHPFQFVMVVLGGRNDFHYHRIKKVFDTIYGVPSQCVQAAKLYGDHKSMTGQIQMMTLKICAKLGGTNFIAAPQGFDYDFVNNPDKLPYPKHITTNQFTMIIGIDVSHPGMHSNQPSTAAVTMSMDKWFARYAAIVESNGHRNEMLIRDVFTVRVKKMFQHWMRKFSCPQNPTGRPNHIIYMRDGIGETQYKPFHKTEWRYFKEMLMDPDIGFTEDYMPHFTVVIARKRHHIRFFPGKILGNRWDSKVTDDNGNPLPGVLVEKDVTHPRQWNFYLNSHRAILGTSRPVEYEIIRHTDERMTCDMIQDLLYQHCYQFQRSKTAVSLHPAIYYAHLASKRAHAHYTEDYSGDPLTGEERHQTKLRVALELHAIMEKLRDDPAAVDYEDVLLLRAGRDRSHDIATRNRRLQKLAQMWTPEGYKEAEVMDRFGNVHKPFALADLKGLEYSGGPDAQFNRLIQEHREQTVLNHVWGMWFI
jgi:eukaryotic translation initiation factor 2C